MKKYGILACAAFMTLLNGRLDAAVESDVVGYTTIEMKAGSWYQVGSPFVALSTETTINTVFTQGFSDGDELNILNTSSMIYEGYYWKTLSDGTAGWCTKRGTTLVEKEIPLGRAVFINKSVDGNVVLAGVVDASQVVEFGSPNGNAWDQIVCVYPESVKLNELKWVGMQPNDELNILNTETTTYDGYYWKELSDGTAGWCTKRGSSLVDVPLYAGQALFINKVSEGTGSCSK